MMDIYNSTAGACRVEILSGDLPACISGLAQRGVEMQDVEYISELEIRFRISRSHCDTVTAFCSRRGDVVKIMGFLGLYWRLKAACNRRILVFGMLLILALTLYLPTKVLFIEVAGNENVTTEEILLEAEKAQLYFGSNRSALRSEEIKNHLLSRLNRLNWVGINSVGCVAYINVLEKDPAKETESTARVNLVAARDGIITRVILENGNARCTVGQAVAKGEMLISAYTDCGISVLVESAKGEVYARTSRRICAVSPKSALIKSSRQREVTRYKLMIGKKSINLSLDSGILYTGCDKMTEVKYLTLPGGFALPLAIIKERYSVCQLSLQPRNETVVRYQLSKFAESALEQDMMAGKILTKNLSVDSEDSVYRVLLTCGCEEMIAAPVKAEIFEGDLTNDGQSN